MSRSINIPNKGAGDDKSSRKFSKYLEILKSAQIDVRTKLSKSEDILQQVKLATEKFTKSTSSNVSANTRRQGRLRVLELHKIRCLMKQFEKEAATQQATYDAYFGYIFNLFTDDSGPDQGRIVDDKTGNAGSIQEVTRATARKRQRESQTQDLDSSLSISNDFSYFKSPDCIEFGLRVEQSFRQFTRILPVFTQDTALKEYRFKLKKAINTSVNAISVNNPRQLSEIFGKLIELLFIGASVRIPHGRVSAADHPLAKCFCTAYLAQKLVDQGEHISTSGNALPVATIVVAVWRVVPEFGFCFLHFLFQQCPLLIPNAHQHLMSYYRHSCHLNYAESAEYLNRISGLTRLYATICICTPSDKNPHSLENAWKWLANILKFDPSTMPICFVLVDEFLRIAGHSLGRVYGDQFKKIVHVIKHQFLGKCGSNIGGSVIRLQIVLDNFKQDNPIAPSNN